MSPSQRLAELQKNAEFATNTVRVMQVERNKLNRDFRRAQEVCAMAHSELDSYQRYLLREGIQT